MWRLRKTVVLLITGVLGSGAVMATDIQVSGLFRGKALLIIDGQSQLMAVGEAHGGVTLLAADSRRARVSVQGVEQELVMNQRIGGGYRASSQSSLQIWPDARGMYRTAGTINGFAVSFLIDTGATTIAMNSETAKRIGLDYRLRSEMRRVSTASAVVDGYGLLLKRVTVGKLTAVNIDAVVIEGEHPDEILLGMSFLGRMEMSHRNGAMELTQKY